jgi:hypothetical protein
MRKIDFGFTPVTRRFETRSLPALTHVCSRPFETRSRPRFLAATLATLLYRRLEIANSQKTGVFAPGATRGVLLEELFTD